MTILNPKITRLREEHCKNKDKISELQARNRDIEKQIRELENTDIVGMVRAKGLTLEDFAALLQTMTAAKPIISTTEQEDTEYDET